MSNFEQYVQTDTSGTTLKQRSLQSALITFAAQPLKLIMGVGATALLARLVTPADFGLVAMVTPLLVLVDGLSNFGLETATVQQQHLSHQQASAAFWLSLKVNVLVITLMVAMGPVLAWVYQQASLAAVTFAMAVGAFSLCLSFQHKALLKRQMKFNLLTVIEVVAIAIATLCAITAAQIGLGYWALVAQVVVMQVLQSVAHWIACGWRPSWPAHQAQQKEQDSDSLRSMFAYGANLTGFRVITRVGMQMDRILMGYIGGAAALGFYDVAYRWAYFPFIQIYTPLFDVAVSSLSRAYANPQTYRRYCRWSLMSLFSLCLPALTFLYVAASDVLLILLGEQWLPAIPIFRVLLIAVFVGSFYRVTKWLYISSGQASRQFRWGLIQTPVMISAVALGAQWGAYGIAIGYTIGTCALVYPSVAFCLKDSPFSLTDFFSALWPSATAAVLTAAGLFAMQPVLSASIENTFLKLCTEGTCFAFVYATIWFLLPGGKQSTALIINNFKQLAQQKRK